MRVATPASVSRLPGAVSGQREPSWVSAMSRRRSRRSARRLEFAQRLHRQQMQRMRPVGSGFDPGRQWVRQI
jgi:hypothetical protein